MINFTDFYQGHCFDAYRFLGAHCVAVGTVFRTYAPNAERVSVIGDFSDWEECPMIRSYDGKFWELYLENAIPGNMYKYRIHRKDGMFVDHCDPYGYGMQLRPDSASIIRRMDDFTFTDDIWMWTRTDCKDKPLNIYEVHMGSFRKPGPEKEDWYTYEELVDVLIPYVKDMGYNYIEMMPLNEYPADNSWGYQSTGFFSPTSRYGTCRQLKTFINACHMQGIGVILDYVPVHFAVDGYALTNYDGTPLFEYPHADIGVSEWGSFNFNHSRGEICSFLMSAANYWLTEYHIDGIRMDAISRAIYWQGNPDRGVNLNSVQFLRDMNAGLKMLHSSAILAAEDSTAYPGVTREISQGGLGFDYKWDMGWMNDTLKFFQTDSLFRCYDYHKLTFSMMYFYSDHFMLPLSHDEVVHGKATILQKMSGDYDGKFPQAKALYLYMFTHPGKKLNFMGNEIGQLREWDEEREQDWFILDYPIHDEFHRFMKKLNHLYLEHPSLYALDHKPEGFRWIDCNSVDRCIYTYQRSGNYECTAVILNLCNAEWKDYTVTFENATDLRVLLDTTVPVPVDGEPQETILPLKDGTLTIDLKPYQGIFFQLLDNSPKKPEKEKTEAKAKKPAAKTRKTTEKKAEEEKKTVRKTTRSKKTEE